MTMEKIGALGTESPQRGLSLGTNRQSPPEAEKLLLNEYAIFNTPLIKIVKPYCTHSIFSEICTARFEISTTHFVLYITRYFRH